MQTIHTSRRDFLKAGGMLVVGFNIAGPLGAAAAQAATPAGGKPTALDQVDSFLAIAPDGKVTLYTGKVDLGTGIRAALPQMAAEELDVPFESITLVEGDTMLTPDQGPTWGSLSVQVAGVQIREAAATARQALLEQASKVLGVPKDQLTVEDGMVGDKGEAGKKVSYGKLIGDKQFHLTVDKKAPQKDPKNYSVVGKAIPRPDIPAKMTGAFTYMQDFRVDGMLHGRVVRPTGIGATLESVDESSVKDIPGVKVVREGNFLGVVAENEWAAIKASQALKAKWSKWEGLPDQDKLYEHVRKTEIAKDDEPMKVGDTKAGLAGAAKKLSATYDFAIHTHGSIGPSCAVADMRDGKATVWTASQAPHVLHQQLVKVLGMKPEAIRVIYVEGAGCYGRNGHEDAAMDAVLMSRAVGRPVRVQWSRADEHGWDPKGPPTLVDMQGGLDDQGNIVAWEAEYFIPVVQGKPTEFPLIGATLAGIQKTDAMVPGNIHRNAEPPYTFTNAHVVCHRLKDTPLRPSWIRSPGRMQNTYANEAFMDELAAAAGADPIEFRLRYLKDPRGIEVIKAAAERAGWEKRPSPKKPDGKSSVVSGRGFAYVKYGNIRTYVATVADVEVDRKTGKVTVKKFTVAHDCGQIINPDGVRNQIEGNMVQTVSRTLKERVTFDRSRVTSLDWASYPILTFPEVPEIDMVLIDRPEEKPWGVGEPACVTAPPAISNAIFDAIGVRMRSIPYTPEKVKAALASQT